MGRLARRTEDLGSARGAAERDAADARAAADAARKELRELGAELELAQARLRAQRECAPPSSPPRMRWGFFFMHVSGAEGSWEQKDSMARGSYSWGSMARSGS